MLCSINCYFRLTFVFFRVVKILSTTVLSDATELAFQEKLAASVCTWTHYSHIFRINRMTNTSLNNSLVTPTDDASWSKSILQFDSVIFQMLTAKISCHSDHSSVLYSAFSEATFVIFKTMDFHTRAKTTTCR